jgi:hypothetical protein
MVSSFCEKLHWTSLAAALNSIKPRLHFGVPDELLPLVEVEGVSPARARALAKAGFSSVVKIAKAAPLDIASVLARSAGVMLSSETAQELLNLTSTMIINNARIKLGRFDLISDASSSQGFPALFSPVSPPLLHQLIGTQRESDDDENDIVWEEEEEDGIFLEALAAAEEGLIDQTQRQLSQAPHVSARKRRRISEMTTVDARGLRRGSAEFEDFGFDSFVLKAIDFNSF